MSIAKDRGFDLSLADWIDQVNLRSEAQGQHRLLSWCAYPACWYPADKSSVRCSVFPVRRTALGQRMIGASVSISFRWTDFTQAERKGQRIAAVIAGRASCRLWPGRVEVADGKPSCCSSLPGPCS